MRRTWNAVLVALLWSALDVTPAWAVVGTAAVTVTGPTGPVAGAKVKIGDEVATTDDQGRAILTVEEGERTVKIEHPDHVTTRQAVTVRGGETTGADVSVNLLMPFMVQNPGGQFGGFLIGPFGLFQSWDLDIEREVETISLGPTSVTFVDESPNRFEMDVKAGGVDVAVGLPGFSLLGWSFFPAISGVAGGADVHIKNTETRNKMSGPGWIAGAGAEVAAVPSSLPRPYLAVGWQGRWMGVKDMDFRIQGQELCSAGIFVLLEDCRHDTRLHSEIHDFYVRGGYGLLDNHVMPFVGVLFRKSDLEFRSDVRGRVGGVEFRDKLEIDFEQGRCACVLGLAGFDVRGPNIGDLGRLFGRVQTEFNGSGYSVFFKLMFGFGFVDP